MIFNPLDKCTVISIVPFDIIEIKHTVYPGRFHIPAAKEKDFSLIVVGPSSWFQNMGEDRPAIQVPTSSMAMAESIINDFNNSQIGCDMVDATPGLGYLPGEFSKEDIKNDPKKMTYLLELDRRQTNWFKALVRISDQLWIRTNGQPASISETARIAAHRLNLEHKEWLKDSHATELVRCPACGSLNSDQVIVCPTCKIVVDPARYAKLGLQFAVSEMNQSRTLAELVK